MVFLAGFGTNAAMATGAAGRGGAIERPSVMQQQALAHRNDHLILPADPNLAAGSPATTAHAAGVAAAPAVAPHATYNGGLQREVLGFAPYWQLAAGNLSDVQWDKVSTVTYFGLTLNGTGGFDNDAGMTGWNSSALTSMINAARTQGDHVEVTVTSFSDASIYPVVTNPSTGQTAITNIINAVRARGIDGVNIDFEGTTSSSYPNIQASFTSWVGSLSQQLHNAVPAALLTLDAYSGSASWNDGFMRIDTLAPNVDAFFIMAYDMTQPNDLPNAPLAGPYTYTDTTSVDQFVAKAGNRNKVILGVPYYGYKFSTSDASFNAPVTAAAGAVNYSDIQADIACASQLTYNWDGASSTPWLSWYSPASGDPCGGNHNSWRETYFDDANSLGLKYDLAVGRDIRGVGIWALGNDHGRSELWREISTHLMGNQWAGWYPLGGTSTGRVAVGTNGDGRLEAFVRGTDGALWHIWQTSPGGGWVPSWYSLGGGLSGDPQVVTNADGRMEIFVVGSDGGLWHAWQFAPSSGWTRFYPLGGSLAGRPTMVKNGDGRLEAFVRGSDGATWHTWQLTPGGGWSPPYSLGGSTPVDPAATRNSDGRLEAFVRGGDGTIYHIWQVAPGSGWGRWYSLGGSFTGAPAVAVNPDGRIEVFATGTDQAAWHSWQTSVGGGWFGFTSLGGSLAPEPAAVRDADGRLEVFAEGTSGEVVHVWQMSVGGGWVTWKTLSGFTAGSPPGVGMNSDGRLELLVRGTDATVWHAWQTVPNGGW